MDAELTAIASDGGCRAKTKRGAPCRAAAVCGSQHCALHGDPSRAAKLGRMGGRKNRHYVETPEVTFDPPLTQNDIKNILAQAIVDLRAKRLDPKIASALTHMSCALSKVLESSEFEARLAHLEVVFAIRKESGHGIA